MLRIPALRQGRQQDHQGWQECGKYQHECQGANKVTMAAKVAMDNKDTKNTSMDAK